MLWTTSLRYAERGSEPSQDRPPQPAHVGT